MNFFHSLRLRPKMLITFISAIIIVMLCVAYINSKILKSAMDSGLNSFHKMITEIAGNSIKTGLEFEDPDELESVLSSFKKQDIISYIKVTDKNDKEVLNYRKEGLKNLKKVENSNLEVFQNITVQNNDDKLGILTIGLSLERSNKAQQSAAMWVFILSIVMIGFYAGITMISAEKIVKPIERITNIAEEIAKGNLNQNIIINRSDEIGLLEASFYLMIDAQRDKAEVAKQIAQGNLSVDINALSQDDVLGHAMLRMKDSISSVITDVDMLVNSAMEGKLDTRANPSNYQGIFRKIVDGMNSMLDSITKPLGEATQVLQNIARQNLTTRMVSDYKGEYQTIKDALNKASENLDSSLKQVAVSAEQVAQAANQIGTGSESVASGASKQASSLEEVSSGMQEMASITNQNSSNSKTAKSLAANAKNSAEKGVKSMNRLSEAIDRIKKSADETAKIIKTIDDIAFQTNLLALNAAVEAARAGDAGKGFAVVAEEVRNLAMRSAEAAKTTSNMIEESVNNADGGVTLNREVLTNLDEINTQINKVGEVMAEITAASEKQNQGVNQVNSGLDQMSQITQQTAANSEESASTAQELASQAEALKSMVDSFQLSEFQTNVEVNTETDSKSFEIL